MTHILITEINEILRSFANSNNAVLMSKYMKFKFPFICVSKPCREEITKDWILNIRKEHFNDIPLIAKRLWLLEQREFQYIACELLVQFVKQSPADFEDDIEYYITTKSWWDTVDTLATKVVGVYLKNHSDKIQYLANKWSNSNNMWLNRAAILFQLKYKQTTDTLLLQEIILQHANSNEFFIKKAIGWALRELSKSNPEFVLEFISSHELKSLSVREASKYLHI